MSFEMNIEYDRIIIFILMIFDLFRFPWPSYGVKDYSERTQIIVFFHVVQLLVELFGLMSINLMLIISL